MTFTDILAAVGAFAVALSGLVAAAAALRRARTDSERAQDEGYVKLIEKMERRMDRLDQRDEQRERELEKVYGRLSALEKENRRLKDRRDLLAKTLSVAISYIATLVSILKRGGHEVPDAPAILTEWMHNHEE